MRKLAVLLSAVLVLNLTAPAGVAYAAAQDAAETHTEEESLVYDKSVQESVESSEEPVQQEEDPGEEVETVTVKVTESTECGTGAADITEGEGTDEQVPEEASEEASEETSEEISAEVLEETVDDLFSLDKNFLVNKEPDANGNYDGDYLVIVNTTPAADSSGYLDTLSAGTDGNLQNIMGYDEYGNALIDPNSVLPELVVDEAALEKQDNNIWGNVESKTVDYSIGDTKTLKLMTAEGKWPEAYSDVECVCISIGEYCTLWIPVNDPIYQADIENGTDVMTGYMDMVTEEFDSQYGKMISMFGSVDYVDETYGDNDGKTAILCYDLEGDGKTNDGTSGYLAGLFSGADLSCPFSNATGNNLDCIHIDSFQGMRRNASETQLSSPLASKGTLVHELQHMIFFSLNRTQENRFFDIDTNNLTWLNETYSAAAQFLCYGSEDGKNRVTRYNSSSAIAAGWPLAEWSNNLDNYALVYLFSQYIRIQYELLGYEGETIYRETLEGLSSSQSDLFASIVNKLNTTKEDILLDYRIALQLKNADGRYGFGGEEWAEAISSNRYYKGGIHYLDQYGAGIVTKNDGSYTGNIENLTQYAIAGVNTQVATEDVSVSINGEDTVLAGDTLQLSATVYPLSISQSVQWSIVSGEDCASININTGLLEAHEEGVVRVRAKSVLAPDRYAEKTITVSGTAVVKEKVRLEKQVELLYGGLKVLYSAEVPENAKVYYTLDGQVPTTSDKEFPAEGLVLSEVGEYSIKVLGCDPAELYADVFDEYNFVIEQTGKPEISIQEIAHEDVTAYEVTFTAQDDEKVYYTLDGSVPTEESTIYTEPFVIENVGSTVIAAFAAKLGYVNSDSVQEEVEVSYKIKNIVLDMEEATLYVDNIEENSVTLTATVLPLEVAQEVEWISENEEVATVDENGKVTAVAKGTTTIVASAGGKTATCVVTVLIKDFSVTEDGVLSKYNGTDREIVIPQGVTQIAQGAFSGNETITSVVCPGSLRMIEDRAFAGCSSLESIVLNDGLTKIGEGAFAETRLSGKIQIPSTVVLVKDNVFYNCDMLEEVIFENGSGEELVFGKNDSMSGVFSDCSALKRVVLPERIKELPGNAFLRCPNLSEVYIPAAVSNMEENVFAYCDNAVIYGIPGSYAQSYAAEYGIPFKDESQLGLLVKDIYINRTDITVNGAEYIGNPDKTVTLQTFVKPVTALNKKLIFASGDESVATVDEAGNVRITGYGKTDISVVSIDNPGLQAVFGVTVLREWTEEEKQSVRDYIETNNDFTLITNIYDSLQEVNIETPLDVVAEWKYPYEISTGTNGYDVLLKQDGYADAVLEDIEVLGIKVTGISVCADDKVEVGKAMLASIVVETESGEEYITLYPDQYAVNWTSSKSTALSVEKDDMDDLQAVVTGVAKNNSTKFTAELILLKDGKSVSTTSADLGRTWFKVSSKVVVTGYRIVDDIKISATMDGAIYEDGFDELTFSNLSSQQVFALTAKAYCGSEKLDAVPLAWKSSNKKVATVKLQKDGTAKLTVLGKGTAYITASASANGGYSEGFRVLVKDSMPRLVQKSVTVNAYKQDASAVVQILPSDGYMIDESSLSVLTAKGEESSFEINNLEEDTYEIRLKEEEKGSVKNGTYSLIIYAEVGEENEPHKLSIKVKVERKKPDVTIVQTPTVLYEKASMGKVEVITDEEISFLDYEPQKTVGAYLEAVSVDDNSIFIQTVDTNSTNYKNASNKGTLRVFFDGYEDEVAYEKEITLAVNKKLPVFTANPVSATLYPETLADTTQIMLLDNNTGEDVFMNPAYVVTSTILPATYQYTEHTESTLPTVKALNGADKTSITYTVRNNAWLAGITATAKSSIKIGKVPTLILGAGKVTLNTAYTVGDYEKVSLDASVKGFEHVELISMTVEGKDAKSQKAWNDKAFAFELNEGKFKCGIADKKYFAKADNYTYIITAYDADGKPVKGTLKVAVVLAKKSPSISFKTKGSINLLYRIGTSVIATPTVKNYSGKIADVNLRGLYADKFRAEVDASGAIVIQARENVALKAKTGYTLQLDVKLDSGVRILTKVKVTPKQTNPKLIQNTKEVVLFETAKGIKYGKLFEVGLKNQTESADIIKDVRLITETDTFGFDPDTGIVYVKESASLKNTKKYTLKFEVHYKDAGTNVKPVTVSLKVDYRK